MSNDRVNASRQRRTVIGWKLDEAYHQAKGSDSGQGLKEANNLLQQALEMMKDKSKRMLHEDCWERWLEIKGDHQVEAQGNLRFQLRHI